MAITYETTFGALSKEDKETAQLIMPREGFRSSVYSDVDRQGTETGLAAGFGHRLTDEDLKQYKVGDEIRHKQALDWLKGDLASTREASQKQASEIPNATEDFQKALQKVNFQLGPGWTQKFPTAWEHMKAGRWDQAIEEIKFTKEGSGQESKWSQQTPERVKDFTQAIQAQGEASQVPSSPEYTEPIADHWEIEEELEKVPKSVDLFDPAKKEENQLQIKDVVNQLADTKWASFYQKLKDPELLSFLPEYLESYGSAGRMLGKNIFEEQTMGENIKPPITNKDFKSEDLEALRSVLLNKKLKPFSRSYQDNDFTRKMIKDGYVYTKLDILPEEANVPPSLKFILGGIWFKINKDQSISIRDNYDYPSDYPVFSKLGSSEEKKPGFSPGNKVEIELPALEKEFN
jgi:GH24 family phage-related lysozyme (muramidase)